MESLDGILIATTNLADNLDTAFERRFLYKIRFDKPENLKPGIEPKGDNVFFAIESDTCTTAVLSEGDLSIIYPGEPHAPGIRHSEEKKNIRKIVFKIKY